MYAKNDKLILREMEDSDHSFYLELIRNETDFGALDSPDFRSHLLDTSKNNALLLSILSLPEETYIGSVCIKNISADTPELGVSIHPNYQNQGFGTSAMQLAAKQFAAEHGTRSFLIRFSPTNLPCRRMVEKMGAQELLSEHELFRELLNHPIPDEIKQTISNYFQNSSPDMMEDLLRYRYDVPAL